MLPFYVLLAVVVVGPWILASWYRKFMGGPASMLFMGAAFLYVIAIIGFMIERQQEATGKLAALKMLDRGAAYETVFQYPIDGVYAAIVRDTKTKRLFAVESEKILQQNFSIAIKWEWKDRLPTRKAIAKAN